MVGCDTVLAHPPEFDLDPEIIAACEANAAMNNSSFTITHDFESAIEGAHVVYPKAWAPKVFFKPPVGEDDEAGAVAINDSYKNWKMTSEQATKRVQEEMIPYYPLGVFDPRFYERNESTYKDPKCTDGSGRRVVRGGSWHSGRWECRNRA